MCSERRRIETPTGLALLLLLLLLPILGCSTSRPGEGAPAEVTAESAPAIDLGPVEPISLSEEQIAELQRHLPESDVELAMAQRACPFEGNPLGSKGRPLKLSLKGRPVFLCGMTCGCEVARDQDRILARVDQLLAAHAGDEVPGVPDAGSED